MKTRIGEMAGRVWKTLGEKEEVAVSETIPLLNHLAVGRERTEGLCTSGANGL